MYIKNLKSNSPKSCSDIMWKSEYLIQNLKAMNRVGQDPFKPYIWWKNIINA